MPKILKQRQVSSFRFQQSLIAMWPLRKVRCFFSVALTRVFSICRNHGSFDCGTVQRSSADQTAMPASQMYASRMPQSRCELQQCSRREYQTDLIFTMSVYLMLVYSYLPDDHKCRVQRVLRGQRRLDS